MRRHGEGEENAQLLRQVRESADRMDSFSFDHVLGLEMLTLLEGGAAGASAKTSSLTACFVWTAIGIRCCHGSPILSAAIEAWNNCASLRM